MCPVFLGQIACSHSLNGLIQNFLLFLFIKCMSYYLKKQLYISETETSSRTSTRILSQVIISLQHVCSSSKLWFWIWTIWSTPFVSFSCSGGGVLDHHSGPLPEHQCHVHPLSEPGHPSWSGSQYRVHWCTMCTLTYCWRLLQLISLCVWLHSCRLANGSASLIAVGNTSRSEFVKHLKRYSSSSGQVRSAASLKAPRQTGQNGHTIIYP